MAKLSQDSRRMYSWWWDSHISPKNSKWLQENLTDMDAKVKVMIKLIEEDADSFARRAEMYYKKRPELMRLVEEFYRAYRAMAERYDHATGVIRHAHRTMAEAFPNQDPLMFADESPVSSGADPRTPDMSTPTRALSEENDISNDVPDLSSSNSHAAKQNGEFTDDPASSGIRRKTLKQLKGRPFRSIESVQKGLNFDETEDKEHGTHTNQNHHFRDGKLSKPDQINESEEILMLKEALARLETEKEAGLVQYQKNLDKLSQLESEISRSREDFRVLRDHATKAENEAVILKESLSKLETEKELKLQEYQRCMDRLSDLENIISMAQEDAEKQNQRASTAETEAQSFKAELDKLALEKDAALNQYMKSLETISILENKVQLIEEDAMRLQERAENTENEVELLKQAISKLTDEKEAIARQYQQCLETISSLEERLKCAQEEAKILNVEIDNGVSKLKGAEEQCLLLERSNQSLHSELESLMLKMGTQTQELTEKQQELGRLWGCVQEERMRFVEAETAFQTLQHLHSQTQEELRSMASELQKRAQLLKVADTQNQSLKDEVLLIRKENKHLDELNASSSLSIMDMQNEISSLKESKEKLKEEIELRIDQRNALQQEIYCLKEELNDLNKKHLSVLEQVHTVGLNPDSFGSSVRQLQEENSNIKENCHRERSEKEALLGKLEIFEQLLEKNSVLETSLSDLNAELEAVRGKIEALEQSLQSLLKEKSDLLDEKATITIQLQETNKNMENLMENNTVVVNSLSDAHYQLEALKANLKELEDSCRLLANEKAGLISEKDGLTSQLENTQMRVEELEKVYGELEGRYIALEKERESTLHKVEELQMSSEVERKEHANYIQMNESRFIGVEAEMRLLREECNWRKRELDEVLDIAISDEIEMFVLCRTAQELEENNFSLLIKNQKLLEESILSKEKISQLEKINFGQEIEIKSLCDQGSCLRAGTYQLMKVLDIVQNHACVDEADQDQVSVQLLLCKLQDMKKSLCKAEEENQKWAVELSILVTWMMQLRLQAQNIKAENDNIEHEFKVQTEQLLVVQSEVHKLLETNEELRSKLQDEGRNKEAVMIQIEDLRQNIMYMQSTCDVLQRERSELCEEKRSLMEKTLRLEEKNNILEEENCVFCGEVLALDNLSLIFRNCAEEKSKVQAEQLLVVQREVHKLLETNENLRSKLQDEGRNKEAVMIQIEDLRRNILDMRSTCDVLYRERSELCEEKRSLMEKTLRLAEKNNILEEENCVLYGEVLAVDNLSLIFRNCAEEKSKVQTEQLLVVQSEVHKLLERNEELRSKLQDEGLNKEAMMIQIEDLRRNIMDMQSTCDVLQRERSELCEEKRSLMEKTVRLEEKNNILEEENCVLCGEVLALDNLSLIFRNCAEEKLMVAKEFGDNINELHAANGVLMGKLSSTEGRLEESEVEMLLLKERLQKSEDDLKLVVTVRDQLSGDIENGKNRLHQMELVLQEAEQKIGLVEKEKYELHKIVEDLRTESDQFKIVRDGQENQIFKLSTNNNHLSTENDHLHEAIQILEAKLHELHEEHNKSKSQGENLHFELKGKINEIDELEIQAASVFGQLQYSMVRQLLFEQKFHELHETCLDYIDQNEGLKNQISSYGPEIVSLKECIASLENHTDSHIKLQNPEKVEFQGAEVTHDPHKNNQNNNERTLMPDMFSDLQDLHARLQAIERASVAMKELMVQENMDLRSKLDASTRQVELLKSGSGHYRRSLKQTSEITEADNALLTKDIMLDQISNGSPYGLSKREPIEMDNQTVELWENADPDGIPGLAVGKSEKIRSPSTVNDTDFYHDHLIKEQKGEFPASGEQIKKELSVDKLEISKRFTESIQEGNKRKVLERIDSDVQKLANLQITVQDLKTKLEVTEKGTRGKAVIECESLKGQLDEADIAIKKLFDFNGRLMKTIEDSSFSDVKLSSFDLEGDGNARKRVSEQARRMSEKIGRLQLEVQKLQFILLKLDDEKEGKTKISETKRRILLRDYLYGGRRKGQGRRKAQFCGCIQPSTIDD